MNSLYSEIEKTRKELILLSSIHGMTSPKTVECSQTLDRLLNLIMIKSTIKILK
jgi:hypothetical protein